MGEETITYHSGSKFTAIHLDNPTTMKAYGKIDANGHRWLLGDSKGILYVLVLKNDGSNVTGLSIEKLGETSIPSAISYLDNGYVYIGSTFGDSQLIRLSKEKQQDSYIEVIGSYANLGPMVDFCVVDLEKQGQVKLFQYCKILIVFRDKLLHVVVDSKMEV